MSKPPTHRLPFLGATAPWAEDDDVTFEHVKREAAAFLVNRLKARVALLQQTDLSVEEIATEMRRQMAECAVDGNLAFAGELSDSVWNLLQWRESKELM